MSNYFLMNKDIKLLYFSINENIFGEEECKELDVLNILPSWFTNIKEWLDIRNYAKHKEHLKKYLNEWGLNNYKGFIEITKCLSLNDSLWVKAENSSNTWSEVNLYKNNFSDIVEKISFEKGLYGLKLSSTSPELTSEGSFSKCWKKIDDNIKLIKRGSEGSSNSGLEPFNEYLASEIAKIICSKSVNYNLINYKNNISTICDIFTDENIGFVPFYKVYPECKNLTDVVDVIDGSKFEKEFREMMVLDAITLNTDRHIGNFGFLFDNNNFEILSFAPVFDLNMCFEPYAIKDDFKDINCYMKSLNHGPKLGGDFIKIAKNLTTNEINRDLRSLLDYEFKNENNVLLENDDFQTWRLKEIENIIHNQCKLILG